MGTTQIIFSTMGIVLTVVGLTAAYIYFRKSRRYKELSYEILPTLSLVSVGPQVRDRIEIKYKSEDGDPNDVAIEDLKAVAVTIHNTGTEAVNCKSKDFQDDDPQMPVTLDFGQPAQILGEPSAETNPKGRKVLIKRDPEASGKVLMDTFLLNPKETVTISTFLTNFPEEGRVRPDWHIEGVRQPKELKREGSTWIRAGAQSLNGALAVGVGVFFYALLDPDTGGWTVLLTGVVVATVGIVGAYVLGKYYTNRG